MFSDTVPASPQAVQIANAADSAIAQLRAALGRARLVAMTTFSAPKEVRDNVVGSLNTLEGTLNVRVANAARNDVIEGRLDPVKYFAAANELMKGIGRNLEVLGDFSYWSNVKAAWDATLAQLGEIGKKAVSSSTPWVIGAAILAFVLYFVVPKVIRERRQLAGRDDNEDDEDEDDNEDEEDSEVEFNGDPDDEFAVRLVKGKGLGGWRRKRIAR